MLGDTRDGPEARFGCGALAVILHFQPRLLFYTNILSYHMVFYVLIFV